MLNSGETKVFNVLINKVVNKFKSPSDFRIMKCSPLLETQILLKTSGTNSFGGTVVKDYCLYISAEGTHVEGDLVEMTGYISDSELNKLYDGNTTKFGENYIDVGRINNALQEYWKEKGLL